MLSVLTRIYWNSNHNDALLLISFVFFLLFINNSNVILCTNHHLYFTSIWVLLYWNDLSSIIEVLECNMLITTALVSVCGCCSNVTEYWPKKIFFMSCWRQYLIWECFIASRFNILWWVIFINIRPITPSLYIIRTLKMMRVPF